ncbi:hypothetical protein BS17DRAFT_817426 [Gyrodon lividus]|nr:hypothetical protein BS17DRAFT_817426 [Gyrodon lividus]
MLQYKTSRAGTRVDGDFLKVHDVETSPEENKVTCWIASEAGKSFSVVWQDRNPSRNFNLTGEAKLFLVAAFWLSESIQHVCYDGLATRVLQAAEKVKKLEAKLVASRKASEKRVKVEGKGVIDLTCGERTPSILGQFGS